MFVSAEKIMKSKSDRNGVWYDGMLSIELLYSETCVLRPPFSTGGFGRNWEVVLNGKHYKRGEMMVAFPVVEISWNLNFLEDIIEK